MTTDPECRISIEETNPGVFFVIDENGEPINDYGIDPGPWSTRDDAEHQRDILFEREAEEIGDTAIERVEWERLYG